MKVFNSRLPLLGIVSVIFAIAFPGEVLAAASLRLRNLQCEYRTNPVGMDIPHPRLSWQFEASRPDQRGQKQLAFHLLVASAPKLLTPGKADLWECGPTNTWQSTLVEYQGKALVSGQQCYWKVRAQDQNGDWTAWSAPARWTMGLLSAEEWQGQWIGTGDNFVKGQGWPPPDNTIPDPWFRKDFSLLKKPSRAVIYIASVGYHELYVNGKRIGDSVLVPNATDHKHRARYVTYEIGGYLKAGENALGIWCGLSWSIFPQYKTDDKPTSPLLLAQAEVSFPGGEKQIIKTDSTWKTHPSPNRLLGVWDFMHFGGELYDANKELQDWGTAALNDPGWTPVKTFNPRLALSADKAEPNKLLLEIKPRSIIELSNRVYRVDMGRNYAGWLELQVSGKPGQRIDMEWSERAEELMTHRLHSAYIIGPKGEGTFRNRFNYGVGRWVTLRGLDKKPSLDQIRGWLIRTHYTRTADFECDDPLLNDIYRTTLWTFENLSLGGYVVDCPQRERMGYGGDAHATTRTGLNNYDLGAFYTKWIEDWRDVQGPDGNLPYTAPTYWGGGGPGWSGYCITLPFELYRRYGDMRVLQENWPMMHRWLAFLETKSENDLLKRWGGEWDFLGDWLWPGSKGVVNGDTPETLFFNNCYWVYNLRTAASIADVLGDAPTAGQLRTRAETVAGAIHKKFFNAADDSYANGFPAYLAIALLVNVPPASLRPAVWHRLEKEILDVRKGHIHAGITGGAFLFQTLLENGREDLIYSMATKTDYPGWGEMLKKRDASTFHEDWESKLSLLHSSYLYIGSYFIEGLGGIRHPLDGFHQFEISPRLDATSGPKSASTRYNSPYGRIETKWKINGQRFELMVTVPPNTSATLHLRNTLASSLRENGKDPLSAAGIRAGLPLANGVQLALESGAYHFTGTLLTSNQ